MILLSVIGYMDPSVFTLIIELLAGLGIGAGMVVAIAVIAAVIAAIGVVVTVAGVTILVFVIKAKRKAARALHIDENANKEVEDDLTVNSDEN